MSASSGLAANKSEFQTGVADGLGWSNGKFGLVTNNAGRRLQASGGKGGGGDTSGGEGASEVDPFTELLDTLVTFGMFATCILALRIGVLLYWSQRANKAYYCDAKQESDLPMPSHKLRPAAFRPLPASFVFPNIEFMFVGLLSIGLVETSVSSLSDNDCSSACSVVAISVLVALGVCTLTAFCLLLRFHLKFRAESWCVKRGSNRAERRD
jgi:hypothetical protein